MSMKNERPLSCGFSLGFLVSLFSSAKVMVREIYYAVMGDKGSHE